MTPTKSLQLREKKVIIGVVMVVVMVVIMVAVMVVLAVVVVSEVVDMDAVLVDLKC